MVNKRKLRLRLWVTLLVLALGAALLATPGTAQTPVRGTWTVMVYLLSDNWTEGAAIGSGGIMPPTNDLPSVINLMEMSALQLYDVDGVSPPPVRAVVQVDRVNGAPATWDDATNSNWTTAHRFRVIPDAGTGNVFVDIWSDPPVGFPLSDLGERDMASPYSLIQFVEWASTNYPADHYALYLWDYSDDWMTRPYSVSPVRWFGYDGDDGGLSHWEYFDVSTLNYALSEVRSVLGKKLDVLALDTNAMGTVEIVHCLSDDVQYLVAAEPLWWWDMGSAARVSGKTVGIAGGFFYDVILSFLASEPEMPARTLADLSAWFSGGWAVTLDAAQMPALTSSLTGFANALRNTFYNDPNGPLAELIRNAWQISYAWWDPREQSDPEVRFGSVEYIDLGCFAELIADQAPEDNFWDLWAAAVDLDSKLHRVVVFPDTSTDPISTFQGLAIMHPYNIMPPEEYRFTWLAGETTWDEWIFTQPLGWGYAPDRFEPDESLEEANVIDPIYDQGWHWFDRLDDMDVSRFWAVGGQLYVVGVNDWGPLSYPYMALINSDYEVLAEANYPNTLLLWVCPEDGWYYTVVTQSDLQDQPHQLGGWTHYSVYAAPVRFGDVSASHWAFRYVAACEQEGLVGGYAGGYRPGVAVTRDQMAVYVARALCGGDENVPEGPRQPSFRDVGGDQWAYRYIEYAKAQGIVGGYAGGFYRPSATVTRGQMAVFVARALAGGDAAVPSEFGGRAFRDVPINHWARKYIQYIANEGVAGGYGDRSYRPDLSCTRDQMAVFMARAFLPPIRASAIGGR